MNLLHGVERKRFNTTRFFISGIAERTNKDKVVRYLNNKGVFPTMLNLFPSKRKGTLSAKMNLRSEDVATLNAKDFWPPFVSCRRWMSKQKLLEMKVTREGKATRCGAVTDGGMIADGK